MKVGLKIYLLSQAYGLSDQYARQHEIELLKKMKAQVGFRISPTTGFSA